MSSVRRWTLVVLVTVIAPPGILPCWALPSSYDATDLGRPGFVGCDVNATGQVAGQLPTATGLSHACLYDPSTGMQDLGTLGGPQSWAHAINDAGQIVGCSYTEATEMHAFLYNAVQGMQDLGTLGGVGSEAYGINSLGQVTGWSWRKSTPGGYCAFLYDAATGIMHDLGGVPVPGASDVSWGYDINNAAAVVGWSRTEPGVSHPCMYDGSWRDLGSLGGNGEARALNEAGQVVGSSLLDDATRHAFLCDPVLGMADLGTLGGATSRAYDINEAGVVVGQSDTTVGHNHAFVYDQAQGMQDLNALIDPSLGYGLGSARAINDRGRILCVGQSPLTGTTSFLLTPCAVPEPASCALLALATGGIGATLRRRRNSR